MVLGAAGSARAARYPLVDFPQFRGLSVHDVLRDSTGSIWVAAEDGLWRWDNDTFTAETQRFPTAQPAACLFEAAHRLWVGTGDGLVGIDLNTMTTVPGPRELSGRGVRRVLRDSQEQIWCATTRGLYRLRLHLSPPTAELVPVSAEDDIYSLAVDKHGAAWAGTRGAVLQYAEGAWTRAFTDTLAGRAVTALAVAADGTLWVGLRGEQPLYRLEDRVLMPVGSAPEDATYAVNVILPHPNGEVWIGTDRGILRRTAGRPIPLDRLTGLAHDAVLNLYVDDEELVWISTRSGLYQLRSPYVLIYDLYDGLPHPIVQTVLPRPNGDFIVGTALGLCRMNAAGSVVQTFRYLSRVDVLRADEAGRLWVGGPDGLVCFDERSGEVLDLPALRELRQVRGMAPSPEGGFWVCTASALWRVTAQEVRFVPLTDPSLPLAPELNGILADPGGTLYVASQIGVLARDADGRWTIVPGSRPANCLARDAGGRIWVGAAQGLMLLEEGFCQDCSGHASPHGEVRDLALDPDGTLWIATPEGISRYRGGRFTAFSAADGLPSDDVRCVVAAGRGVLLVGTAAGLAIVESGLIDPSRASPRVAVTGFRAGGEQYVIGRAPLRVPNWQRNVSFSFQGLGFRQGAREVRFSSRLLGFETEWSAPTRTPTRSFTNLPWGDYEFQVRAINTQGMWSDQIATVSFAVGPPVWVNPWFLAGCTICLSALAGWIVATQRKKHQLQQAAAAATVAKNEFLAKVSHEIRTPLTVILGCTETLERPGPSTPRFDDSLDAIRRNSRHLLGLINDLLDLSKIEAGHLSVQLAPTAILDVLAEVEAIMRAGAERHGLEFRILYESDLPDRIITDAGRLTQTLINLVGNAIKFTPAGHIHIRVRVEVRPDGRWLVFAVEDTGVGIPADKTDVIFEAFAQAESTPARKYAGTGLGLAISKSVAARLHGRLTVQSEVGRGSTFTLAIDLAQAAVELLGLPTRLLTLSELTQPRAATGPHAAPAGGEPDSPALAGHVLVAEDAPDISTIMRMHLESAGARVTVVDNGPDAVEAVYDGSFQAVMMDIHMPGMDGIEAIREIRARGVSTPIIVISADSTEARCREYVAAGADGFIAKPFSRAAFLREAARYLPASPPPPPPAPVPDATSPIRSDLDLTSPRMAAAVAEFARTLTERVGRMEAALAGRDHTNLAELAHQLKGAGGINGYMCVSDQARDLEQALQRNDLAAVRNDLHSLRNLAERIRAGL